MEWIAPAADVPCEELGDDAHLIAALFVVRRVVDIAFHAELSGVGVALRQYGVNVCSETTAGDVGAGLGNDGWQVIQHGGISQKSKKGAEAPEGLMINAGLAYSPVCVMRV